MKFTYSSYLEFVSALKALGYSIREFGPPELLPSPSSPFVILRHDVDVSLEAAVRFAQVEHDHGISSSYFVMLSNPFYNTFATAGRRALRRLRELGHGIGLHFDETTYRPTCSEEFNNSCGREVDLLEYLSEGSLVGVSFHRPDPSRISAGPELTDPLPHSYLPFFMRNMEYCSDSTGRWRFGPPNQRQAVKDRQALHLLTHPIWWGEEDCAPSSRLRQFMTQHQHRMTEGLEAELSVSPAAVDS